MNSFKAEDFLPRTGLGSCEGTDDEVALGRRSMFYDAEHVGAHSGGGSGPVGASQSEPLSTKSCLCVLGMLMGFV